jgi:hypothetical protein
MTKKRKNKKTLKGGICPPCVAAAAATGIISAPVAIPVGIGAVVTTYGAKKLLSKSKKSKTKKTQKKMKGGGTGKFKKNEKILYIQEDGTTYQAKFRRYISPDKAMIKLLSRKALTPLIIVNTRKLRTIKKTIMNTKKRQKNRREDTIRRKRNFTLTNDKTDELSKLFTELLK